MTKFWIITSGIMPKKFWMITSPVMDLGIYEGDTVADALDALARGAGYESYKDAPDAGLRAEELRGADLANALAQHPDRDRELTLGEPDEDGLVVIRYRGVEVGHAWAEVDEPGANVADWWDWERAYLGPDCDGVHPTFTDDEPLAVRERRNRLITEMVEDARLLKDDPEIDKVQEEFAEADAEALELGEEG